jgi:hypothetical protein
MRFSRWFPRISLLFALLGAALLDGCGNSCFVAVSNNGNGSVVIKASNPPPSCSLSQGMGTMTIIAMRSAACVSCTAAIRPEHIYLTVRSVQLHSSNAAGAESLGWLEVAPQLAAEPARMDLLGEGMAGVLSENAAIPAGSYDQVRLQLSGNGAHASSEESAYGTQRSNFAVMADRHVEPLDVRTSDTEIRIALQSAANDPLTVLPDSKTEIRLVLHAQQEFVSLGTASWEHRTVLVGSAVATRTSP